MPILNYTTKVSVDQTVGEIQRILAKAGASAILNEYDQQGNISGVKFKITIKGQEVFYGLPIDIAGITGALKKDREYRDDKHTRRVAWRILKDWIEAQMAIVQAGLAAVPQVFLPYMQTRQGTVYECFERGGFTALEHKGDVA